MEHCTLLAGRGWVMWWMAFFFYAVDAFYSLSQLSVHNPYTYDCTVRVCVSVHCPIFQNVSLLNPQGVNVCNGFQITVRLSFVSVTRIFFVSHNLYRWHLFGSSWQRENQGIHIYAKYESKHINQQQQKIASKPCTV